MAKASLVKRMSTVNAIPVRGEAKGPSDCGPGNPRPRGCWTSTSSGRPSGGCSRAWRVVAGWAPGPAPTCPHYSGTRSVLPASPYAPCPAAPALTPRPSGSSGCLSPSPGCAPGDADAPSPGGPQLPPFSVLPASPCTSGEAVAPDAACRRRPWWPWARPPAPTGPLSRTGTGPGAMGCLMWCAWT